MKMTAKYQQYGDHSRSHEKAPARVRTKPYFPCVLCGEPEGYRSPAARKPSRYASKAGPVCRKCYRDNPDFEPVSDTPKTKPTPKRRDDQHLSQSEREKRMKADTPYREKTLSEIREESGFRSDPAHDAQDHYRRLAAAERERVAAERGRL